MIALESWPSYYSQDWVVDIIMNGDGGSWNCYKENKYASCPFMKLSNL